MKRSKKMLKILIGYCYFSWKLVEVLIHSVFRASIFQFININIHVWHKCVKIRQKFLLDQLPNCWWNTFSLSQWCRYCRTLELLPALLSCTTDHGSWEKTTEFDKWLDTSTSHEEVGEILYQTFKSSLLLGWSFGNKNLIFLLLKLKSLGSWRENV